MAVVHRTVLRWTNSHVYAGHSGSLGGIYPLKRIGTPQKIARLKVLNRKSFHDPLWPMLHLS
jgi:hypothetical protein